MENADKEIEEFEEQASHALAASGAASSSKAKQKLPKKLRLSMLDDLKPPCCYFWADSDCQRLRVYYGRDRATTSMVYSVSMHESILHCLAFAWKTHIDRNPGVVCPYEFEKVQTTRPTRK